MMNVTQGLADGLDMLVRETKATTTAAKKPPPSNGDRYVRTSEGSRRYGVPIGARITPKGEVYDKTGRRIGSINRNSGRMTGTPGSSGTPGRTRSVLVPGKVKNTVRTYVAPRSAPTKPTTSRTVKPAAAAKPAVRKPVSAKPKPAGKPRTDAAGVPVIRQTGGYRPKPLAQIGVPKRRTVTQLSRDLNWKPSHLGGTANAKRPKLFDANTTVVTAGQSWADLAREAGTSIRKLKLANGMNPDDKGKDGLKPKAPPTGVTLKMTTKQTRKQRRDSKKAIHSWNTEGRRELKVLQAKARLYAKNTFSGVKKGRDSAGNAYDYVTFDADRVGNPDGAPKAMIYRVRGGKWTWKLGKQGGESNTLGGAMKQLRPFLPNSGRADLTFGKKKVISPYSLTAAQKAKAKKERDAEQAAESAAADARKERERQAQLARQRANRIGPGSSRATAGHRLR